MWQKRTANIPAGRQLIYSTRHKPWCVYVCERGGGAIGAAAAPSAWQGPVINESSQPRSLGQAWGHTSVCHSGLTPSPSPAASRSPRDVPDVPRFPYAAAAVVKSQSWHCVVWHRCQANNFPPKFWVYYSSFFFAPSICTQECFISLVPDADLACRCWGGYLWSRQLPMMTCFGLRLIGGVGLLRLVANTVEKYVISAFFPSHRPSVLHEAVGPEFPK